VSRLSGQIFELEETLFSLRDSPLRAEDLDLRSRGDSKWKSMEETHRREIENRD
jgi:hypothetical protein